MGGLILTLGGLSVGSSIIKISRSRNRSGGIIKGDAKVFVLIVERSRSPREAERSWKEIYNIFDINK